MALWVCRLHNLYFAQRSAVFVRLALLYRDVFFRIDAKSDLDSQGRFSRGEVVGSVLRYFNVAVIPSFPDARVCGRLPRFGTLVLGAEGRSPCGLGTFPALQI